MSGLSSVDHSGVPKAGLEDDEHPIASTSDTLSPAGHLYSRSGIEPREVSRPDTYRADAKASSSNSNMLKHSEWHVHDGKVNIMGGHLQNAFFLCLHLSAAHCLLHTSLIPAPELRATQGGDHPLHIWLGVCGFFWLANGMQDTFVRSRGWDASLRNASEITKNFAVLMALCQVAWFLIGTCWLVLAADNSQLFHVAKYYFWLMITVALCCEILLLSGARFLRGVESFIGYWGVLAALKWGIWPSWRARQLQNSTIHV